MATRYTRFSHDRKRRTAAGNAPGDGQRRRMPVASGPVGALAETVSAARPAPAPESPSEPARRPWQKAPRGNVREPAVSGRSETAGTATPTDAPADVPQARTRRQLVLMLFLFSLVIPLKFHAGPLLLTPYRLVLLVAIIPLFAIWVSGRAGRIFGIDFLIFAFVLWIAVTLLVNHGLSQFELIAITAIETLGGFLAGRVLVRNRQDFDVLIRALTIIMLLFVPAAILESLTGIRVFAKIADMIGQTHPWVHASGKYEQRLGMYRSQMVFEHPILFGVFAASAFGLLYYANRNGGRGIMGWRRAWMPAVATFFSLSSGAYLALIAQIGLVTWDKLMHGVRHHWKILLGLGILAYVVVDLLSNRTPIEVFISYAAFSAHNGYMRINIFNFGMDNVWAHPVFGLGMNDWVRPRWLHAASVDNFWLLMAMRHGFPGFLLIAAAFLGTIIRLSSLKVRDPWIAHQRTGLMVVLVGLVFVLMTVHVWGAVYVFVCFLLGAGVWLRDYARDEAAVKPAGEPAPHNRAGARR